MPDFGAASTTETFEHSSNCQAWASASWFEECQVEAEEWLINGLMPKRSYCGLFGRRGSAKSFYALEMACCGALGLPFLGEEVVQRFGTMFCVGEKKSRFGKRVEAWRRARDVNAVPINFRWGVPNLLDEAEIGDFIAEVNAAKAEFARRGAPLGLIVLDTLARSLKHASVSDPEAAGTGIEAIQRIIDECGVTVMPLAHVAKTENAITQKGAGEWEDAADALIRIDRKDTEALRTVTLTKQSDDADGLAYGFELDIIEVGHTPAGRRITSCVIRQVDLLDTGDRGTKPLSARLTPEAETVLRAFDRLADGGQTQIVPLAAGIMPNTPGVQLDELRDCAYALGLKEALKPAPDAEKSERAKWVNTRKRAFQRAVEKLEQAKVLRQERGLLWRI